MLKTNCIKTFYNKNVWEGIKKLGGVAPSCPTCMSMGLDVSIT